MSIAKRKHATVRRSSKTKSSSKRGARHCPRWVYIVMGFLFLVLSPFVLLRIVHCTERAFELPNKILFMPHGIAIFTLGGAAFLLLFLIVQIPAKIYIVIHELTHALFAILSFSRVSDLRFEENHGSLNVKNPNAIELLAPYFFPIPAAVVITVLAVAKYSFDNASTLLINILTAMLGFTWCFHMCYTINSLVQPQTDLERNGYFFSLSIILFLNLAFMLLILKATT